MKRTVYECEVEIANLKRALIAKDKEIERIKFGTLIFYGTVTQLDASHDYYEDSITDWRSYTKLPTEYTLKIKLNNLKLTQDDMKRLMSFKNLKFTAELDNES